MSVKPGIFTLTSILVVFATTSSGCLTLRTARPLSQGEVAVRVQSSVTAPPPYLGSVTLSRGMTGSGELSGGFAFLAGARDEPGIDLEWFQAVEFPALKRTHQFLSGVEAGLGLGIGTYVIDKGMFIHTTQALSIQKRGWSPILLHRLTYDLDSRTRQELYLGVELFSQKRLRFYLAGGSRDLWNRDEWVIVFGSGLHLGGGR